MLVGYLLAIMLISMILTITISDRYKYIGYVFAILAFPLMISIAGLIKLHEWADKKFGLGD